MKTRLLIVCVALGMVLLQGCFYTASTPPGAQPVPFTIEVFVDKSVYRVGEYIVITVRASQDCYLSLYDISTLGEVSQLFPNRFASNNQLQRGRAYRIPAEADAFNFKIFGPAGVERIRAVGTIEDVNVVDQLKVDRNETFPKIKHTADQFDLAVSQKLQTIPTDRWTEASVTFRIVE